MRILLDTSVVRRVWVPAVVVALLSVHAGLLAWEAGRLSPTVDEPAHLVAGLAMWEFGRFEVYKVNPPLTELVAALPAHFAGFAEDWDRFHDAPGERPEFDLGRRFFELNRQRGMRLLIWARWACIPFSLLGGLFCFFWSRELYGNAAGLAALTLWCFDPNILAHGALVTPDVAATAFGLGAGYAFWRWLKRPTAGRAVAAGLLLGLAELSKTSWIVLFGLWPLLWLFWRAGDVPRLWRAGEVPRRFRRFWRRDAGSPAVADRVAADAVPRQPGVRGLAGILLLGLYVLNCGYLFDGSFKLLGDYTFIRPRMTGIESRRPEAAQHAQIGNRFAGTALAWLPVPLPQQYLEGLDSQTRDIGDGTRQNYLRGEWRPAGWWYYYLYCLLVKVSHGTQALVLLACVGLVVRRVRQGQTRATLRDEVLLLAPAVCLLVLLSAHPAINRHFRYALPSLGVLLIFGSRCLLVLTDRLCRICWQKPLAILAGVLLAVAATESLRVYPHSLAFFNLLSGGPANGHRHLLGSNLDWGQDLLALKRWQAAHRDIPLRQIVYGGDTEPAYLGIDYAPVPTMEPGETQHAYLRRLPPGVYAVSVAYLAGYQGGMFDGTGRARVASVENTTAFGHLEFVGRCGAALVLLRKLPEVRPAAATGETATSEAGGGRSGRRPLG